MDLPKEFLNRMKTMLPDDYTRFMDSYDIPRQAGLRVNTLKIRPEVLRDALPFPLTAVPWTTNGYYYNESLRPARHPYYSCGLYYLQEPSAMAPASLLPIEPGDFVLDLCAAPGGKATELGSRLRGRGLLVANDISNSRARALLRNIELFGITNAVITNETPERLSRSFPGYFNKILVDAPCSGEGMFRKEPAVAAAWTPDKPERCARMQQEIVARAIEMLMPGGLMLYSTCTFAPVENEGTISWILDHYPDMEIIDLPEYEPFDHGNPHWGNGHPDLAKSIRIWPHHANGEGHFLALLKKKGISAQPGCGKITCRISKNNRKLLEEFFKDFQTPPSLDHMEIRGEKVYLLPPISPDLRGLHFLRSGVYLGDLKKNRFEPSQQLALIAEPLKYAHCIHLTFDDPRIERYLKGETLLIEPDEAVTAKGWQLLSVDSHPLGWGKLVNGILKNKYPAGWRLN